MKKIQLLLLLCSIAFALPAQKMQLGKPGLLLQPQRSTPRLHPWIKQLNTPNLQSDLRKGANNNRLLVILVDFAVENPDDTNTSGDGKFPLEADPNYLYSIGSPPYNQQYFETNLEAMRYYYLAASANSYDLQFEVWPQDRAAYTLPHPMGYYNPVGASNELFISRMEEYFKSSFELADSLSPELDFGSFGHYMIIHAGSDWQHDIFGDTPSDIPSFFIRVGSGKEAIVDEGTVLISNACNVPSTIAQDFETTEQDGVNIHSGYGALNAVLAHEFGHSLGLVDLYDVYSYRPMVGMFDIMDSGGSGVLVDQLDNGDLVFVEGALPALPGAFSRNLMFGDFFAKTGYLKEFPDFELFSPLALTTVSARQSGANISPHTYKIPLSPKEYLLVENRSVDPDGDGGTAVFGALDGRVILYPTPFDDPTNTPSYEYDYLLPSFIKSDGSAVGGGVLIWHINEAVIYDEGHTYNDGSWVSNFQSNTVNTELNRKGVAVVEADGLNDLGSDYSMYWTGTPYEYFHAKKPVLDVNGNFVSWSTQEWKPALNSSTNPPLHDSFGLPGMYHLSQINNPSASMNFTVNSGFFEDVEIIDFAASSLLVTDVINSGFNDYDLPVIHLGEIELLSNVDGDWENLMGTFYDPMAHYDFPPVKADNNGDGFFELVTVNDWTMRFLDFADVDLTTHQITFPAALSVSPVSIGNSVYAYMPSRVFQNEIYKISNYEIEAFAMPNQADILKLAGWGNRLVALGSNQLCIYDTNLLFVSKRYELPDTFGEIDPIIFNSSDPANVMIFVMSNSGNLYRIYNEIPELIFANHGTAKPGQLGLTKLGNISPVVFFGLGTQLYALKPDGTILSGFPYQAAHNISAQKYPLSLNLSEQALMFFPLSDFGYLALDKLGRQVADKCLYYPQADKADFLFYHPEQNTLNWYYPDSQGRLFIHSISGLASNPILFSGYRNGGSGVFNAEFSDEGSPTTSLNAYIYPNPVRKSFYRLRLENYSGASKVSIYDISGKLVKAHSITASLNNPREVELDTNGLSSGVYILTIENNGKHKRLKFAVEN